MRHWSGLFDSLSCGFRRRKRYGYVGLVRVLAPLLLMVLTGCTTAPPGNLYGVAAPGVPFLPGENPIFVPEVDREFLWNQLVDAIDDDFRIEREQRMQVIGGVITEGMIETFPTTGSTLLEPWRSDSRGWFQRWYATLQTIRRRAAVRVTPVPGGYSVGLAVTIELEDLGRPEQATVGAVYLQHDGSIPKEQAGRYTGAGTLGWIPMGRDTELEQKILADIRDRVGYVPPAAAPAAPSPVAPGVPLPAMPPP